MCGIAGVIWHDLNRPAPREAVKVMTDVIFYRGPDDEGLYGEGPVAFGQRRLSILDLSRAGHQPMRSGDGRYVLVFNGEIYNYIELRQQLTDLGHSFVSNTDTEVLLEAYRQWGSDCVSRFNGMWAFAIYDVREQTIFFSRDRFGIKPLYYVLRHDALAFASEIKAILAAFPDERRANLPYLYHFLPSGAFDDGPETSFANVLALLPAHNAVYDIRRATLRVSRYWDLDVESFRSRWGQGDPVDTLRELLQSSIDLHMRSDVPVGTCLSGGVDSSTLVCLMSRRGGEPVHTFSGLYPDRDCDERRYVDAVNGCARTLPGPVMPEPKGDLIDDLAKITWHQDEPTAGPGLYTQYHVMRRASEDVKVILDGQGADELFAGYLPYFTQHASDLASAGKRGQAAMLLLSVARHWGLKQSMLLAPHVFGQRVVGLLRRLKAQQASPSFFHPAFTERVRGQEIARHWPTRLPSALNNTLYWHLAAQSIPALLHYEDRNSMAYSIEARVPLLDYRIVEFALALAPQYKIHGSWTKWVLRQAASNVLPAEVAWRRSKMGYPTPFARWLRQPSERDKAAEVLFSDSLRQREIVPETTLRSYWETHQSGKADLSWLLYRYLTLELWYRQFIDGWHPNPARPPRTGAASTQRVWDGPERSAPSPHYLRAAPAAKETQR
jgi:asparagine synthase (glutamine-hydrolysing)